MHSNPDSEDDEFCNLEEDSRTCLLGFLKQSAINWDGLKQQKCIILQV